MGGTGKMVRGRRRIVQYQVTALIIWNSSSVIGGGCLREHRLVMKTRPGLHVIELAAESAVRNLGGSGLELAEQMTHFCALRRLIISWPPHAYQTVRMWNNSIKNQLP